MTSLLNEEFRNRPPCYAPLSTVENPPDALGKPLRPFVEDLVPTSSSIFARRGYWERFQFNRHPIGTSQYLLAHSVIWIFFWLEKNLSEKINCVWNECFEFS